MKCPNHPRYLAKRAPRCDCVICWGMYKEKQVKL